MNMRSYWGRVDPESTRPVSLREERDTHADTHADTQGHSHATMEAETGVMPP